MPPPSGEGVAGKGDGWALPGFAEEGWSQAKCRTLFSLQVPAVSYLTGTAAASASAWHVPASGVEAAARTPAISARA